jgi:dynamin 1-like protein
MRKFSSSCDADEIRQEIEAETRRHLARARTMVSADPIQLAIYSPHVPNLTMVDMPGALPKPCVH